jgi:hypothetical protein
MPGVIDPEDENRVAFNSLFIASESGSHRQLRKLLLTWGHYLLSQCVVEDNNSVQHIANFAAPFQFHVAQAMMVEYDKKVAHYEIAYTYQRE